MSLAREIVRLFTTSWATQRADAFAPSAEHRLGELPQAVPVLERLARQAEPWKPIKVLRLILQALEIHREELSPRLIDSMFVATVPGLLTFGARPTELVIREMLQGATRKVFALGYQMTYGPTLDLLRECARRGIDVTLVCDRERADLRELQARWPEDNPPRVFVDRARVDALAHSKMHCKAILVDDRDLLITSANLTLHGMRGNIEFGVRMIGGSTSQAAVLFDHLLRSGLLVDASQSSNAT